MEQENNNGDFEDFIETIRQLKEKGYTKEQVIDALSEYEDAPAPEIREAMKEGEAK